MAKILEVVGIVVLVIGAVALSAYIEFGGLGFKVQKAYVDLRNKTVLKIPAVID